MGGEPTQEKIGLPLTIISSNNFPDDDRFNDQTRSRTKKGRRRPNCRKCRGSMLSYADRKISDGWWSISKCNRASVFKMKDEQKMVDWIKSSSPGMLSQLWPKIQSAIATSTSSTTGSTPAQSQ